MRQVLISLFLLVCYSALGANEPEKAPDATPAKEPTTPVIAPVVRESTVTVDGKKIPYKVTTGKLQLKQEDGKPRASIFHVSYERTDIKDLSTRPVMFAFNGGPGSSAVWLHLGGCWGQKSSNFQAMARSLPCHRVGLWTTL